MRLIVSIVFLLSTSIFAQNISVKGIIPSEKIGDLIGQITIFSSADSTLKKGSYIDSSEFELSFNGKLNVGYYAKIKLPGYVDTIVKFTPESKEVNLGIIQLEADLNLEAVEIVYREPAFERTMDGIKINVSGTTLEQLTNLFEILKASPKLTSPDDERIEIIGKGSPLILIDRQPILSNDELKAIPAAMVQKIEIITNPSAKYKAQGRGSGVIEVYTKDFNLEGYNMTINGAGGVNTQLKPTANLNLGLSLKKRKFSLNANIGTHYRERYSFGDGVFTSTDDSQRKEVTGFNAESSNIDPHVNIKGAYKINDKHKITLGIRGHSNRYSDTNLDSSVYYQNDIKYLTKMNNSSTKYTWLNGSSFLNYLWETDTNNSAFEINVNYNIKVDESSGIRRNQYTDAFTGGISDFNIKNDTKNRPNIAEVRSSYEHVFDTTGWKMSGGASYSVVFNGKEFNQFNEQNEEWIVDPLYTNSYDYTEQNASAFAEVSKNWDKLGVRAGVSGEYTDLNGYSNSLDKEFIDSTYALLFPSASVMIEPNEKVGVTLSYNSGIDRPRFSNYDPFVVLEDSLMITYGNPYLKPEVRQNFGFNLDLFYKYSLSVDYSFAKNPQSSLSFLDTSTFLVNFTPWNAESNQGLSVSVSVPLKTDWYSGWNSVWFNYNKYSFTPIFGREDFFNVTYGLWSYSNFFLPKNFTLTNRLYVGKWGSDNRRAQVRVHWGMRLTKKMYANKFQVYLDVEEITPFVNRYEDFAGNYTVDSSNRWSFTSFKVGLYYKFGRLKQDTQIKESESGQSDRI